LYLEVEMEGEFRRGGLVGPIVLIGLGVVFLLNNLGLLEWSVWDVLLRTWPLILIAWGVDLLIVRRTAEATLFTLVLILVILAGGVWFVAARGGGTEAERVEVVSVALPSSDQAELLIAPGVGYLHIHPSESPDDLISGSLGLSSGQEVEQEVREAGSVAIVNLRSEGVWFWPLTGSKSGSGKVGRYEWELAVNTEMPTKIRTELGAGLVELDLSGMVLEGLEAELGVGRTEVHLPDQGSFDARLSGAVGMTEVIVPRGLAVRISLDTGLAGRQVEGFRQEGDVYFSPSWTGEAGGVNLEIDQAIGMVVVRVE
jgi:hypothetical protein